MRAAVDHLFRGGLLLPWGIPATGVLVETLLDRGADGDMVEAEAAIERLAAAPADEGLVLREIWLLRLRALLARAHGDAAAYADFGIATATWRKRLASRGISRGPRRCHDGGRAVLRDTWHGQHDSAGLALEGSSRQSFIRWRPASPGGEPHARPCPELRLVGLLRPGLQPTSFTQDVQRRHQVIAVRVVCTPNSRPSRRRTCSTCWWWVSSIYGETVGHGQFLWLQNGAN